MMEVDRIGEIKLFPSWNTIIFLQLAAVLPIFYKWDPLHVISSQLTFSFVVQKL